MPLKPLVRLAAALCALALGCAPGTPPDPGAMGISVGSGSPDEYAVSIVAEVDRLAALEPWPGFDPSGTPAAIHVGRDTYLFRHPAPPEGFVELPRHAGVRRYPGRHPSVTGNTSVELAGVRTATVRVDPSRQPASTAARLLLHELFHVFQLRRHPDWQANEVDLFTYPIGAAGPLALRRLETEALRRALESTDADGARCWARAALDFRRRRFSELSSDAAAYERRTELHEGLARYVEEVGLVDRPAGEVLPEAGFPPAAVRERGYATGLVLARLLDRLSPVWRHALDGGADIFLDELLAQALPSAGSAACGFGPGEIARTENEAVRDVAELRAARDGRLRAFETREGARIVIDAAGEPLFPAAFDPLNVEVLSGGKVLHGRFLRLGNGAATIEILDRSALTVAAGAHPLFEGVRSVSVTGLPAMPTIERDGGTTTIEADGVRIEMNRGSVERTGNAVRVRVGSPVSSG